MNYKVKIEKALMGAGKGCGMKQLLEYMDDNGFYSAPCSGSNHLCKEGGLAEHSWNVYVTAIKLLKALIPNPTPEQINQVTVCSLLHDLGKMGDFGKPNYVPNMVQSKKKNKESGEYDIVQSDSKPYKTNAELLYLPHELRSAKIANKFIPLDEEEEFAIIYHNGLYGDFKYAINGKETPLYLIIHYSDLWCCRITEGKVN